MTLHSEPPARNKINIDKLLERFEREWKGGRRPVLDTFLPSPEVAGRQQLVLNLVRIDLEFRLKAGDAAPLIQTYFHDPALGLLLEDQGTLIKEEFQWRWERGDAGLSREKYLERFPELQEVIKQLQPTWDCPKCRRGRKLAVEDVIAADLICPKCGESSKRDDLPSRSAFADSKQELAPVDLLRYLKEENKVGVGGMGEVYRIPDPGLGRESAMKVVGGLQDRDNAEANRRLVLEAQIAARLDHSGVVTIYRQGRLPDGRAYYTMRLIPGRTLKDWLRVPERAGQKRPDFLDVFQQVCTTLKHAPDRGIIHRDPHPE